MITTTAEYKTAISAASRNLKPKVEIYFDGEGSPPTTLDQDDIANINFLEEGQAEGDNPLGAVSSNEIVIVLRNDEHQFNPENASSPYYGKLNPNILVKPYYGLKVNGSFEWISLGSFWTGYWEADSTTVFAEVICNDRLFSIGNEDMPLIPTMENISRSVMFETLFQAVGLASDDYSIDVSLASDNVSIGYYPDGDVRNALNRLAEMFNCNVFMTRDNIIKVLNNQTAGNSVKTFNDTDLIISSNVPQRFDEIYSDVEITYSHHSLGELSSLLVIEDLVIEAAGSTYTELKFTSAPIGFVSHIKITEIPHISITSFSIGTWGMSITIANDASAEQTIKLEVMGYPLEIVENKVTVRDATAYALLGSKARILPINNYLTQDAEETENQANLILPIVSDPKAYVELATRGDMSIELGDVITANDVTNKLANVDSIPIRFNYRYDGGLECDIRGIKKSARIGA
jgi:hypothetical protein